MVVYGLSMGATRALTGETFMNVHAADEPEVRQTVLGEVLGAAVAVGVASSVVAAVAAVDRRWRRPVPCWPSPCASRSSSCTTHSASCS